MGLTRIDVRIPDEVRQRIRALAQSWPGSPTESYVIRYLLEQGLAAVDRPHADSPRPPLPEAP